MKKSSAYGILPVEAYCMYVYTCTHYDRSSRKCGEMITPATGSAVSQKEKGIQHTLMDWNRPLTTKREARSYFFFSCWVGAYTRDTVLIQNKPLGQSSRIAISRLLFLSYSCKRPFYQEQNGEVHQPLPFRDCRRRPDEKSWYPNRPQPKVELFNFTVP